MNEDSKSQDILKSFHTSVENYREALRLSGVSEASAQYLTAPLPNFNRMLPTDIKSYFQMVKEAVILHFSEIGFSHREISRRIGGSSTPAISEIIARHNPPSTTASIEEVKNNS